MCPLCKRPFLLIVYDIKSNKRFKAKQINHTTKVSVETSSLEFRRSLYDRDLAGKLTAPRKMGRWKSPFNSNPEWPTHRRRILEWTKRELIALTDDPDPSLVVCVVEGLLEKNGLDNLTILRNQLSDFLFCQTDAFVLELAYFVCSGKTVGEFDQRDYAPVDLEINENPNPQAERSEQSEPTQLAEWLRWQAHQSAITIDVSSDDERTHDPSHTDKLHRPHSDGRLAKKRKVIDLCLDSEDSEGNCDHFEGVNPSMEDREYWEW